MLSWRSSNIDEMVLAAFVENGASVEGGGALEGAERRQFCCRRRGLCRDGAIREALLVNLLRASLVGGEATQDYVDGGLCPCSRSDWPVHEV